MVSGPNPLAKALAVFRARVLAAGRRRSVAGSPALGLIRVTIVDDSKARGKGIDRLFDALGATIDDVPAILGDPRLIEVIRAAHARNFDTEGASGRGRWAALSPRTLAERSRLGFGPGPILTRTGALREHVLSTPAVIRRGPGVVQLEIRPANSVGGVPKYGPLALGSSTNNLPGRPMVTIGPASAARITSSLQRALRARALQNGLR